MSPGTLSPDRTNPGDRRGRHGNWAEPERVLSSCPAPNGRRRILFLNQFYPPDPAATGQLVADVAAALARRGHQVHVLCSRRPYGGERALHPREELVGGVHVHRVGATGFGRASILGRAADYASFYALAWTRMMALPGMDVCVALTTPPFISALAVDLARRRRSTLIHWVMDMYPELLEPFGVLRGSGLPYRLLAWASRQTYRHADRIVSLGEVMTERIGQAGTSRDKIVTIPNWVPGEVIRPIPPDRSATRGHWTDPDEITVMCSGNLGVGHDLEPVVRAAKELDGAFPLHIIFVGYGRMRQRLEALTAELGLTCVDFHSPRPLSELADSLAAGDIHIVSQHQGTQGLLVPSKIYGVLAAARPVLFIGPEDTEVARLLRDSGAGLIVPPGDVQAATDALKTFLADPSLRARMGAAGREWYDTHLGLERSVAKWIDVIENVATPTPSARP